MKISIIVPVYNEEKNLKILDKKMNKVMQDLAADYEIVYVNDGSLDRSAGELKKIWESSQKVKVVDLGRNFGQTQAIAAGIDNSQGEIIITIDADLQNDPADIPKLLAKLKDGYDVVSGWRVSRNDNFILKKLPSFFANKISALATGIKLHDIGCTLKVYKREVLEQIEFYGEIHRFLPVYAGMQGAKIAEVRVKHYKRQYGHSKYGISRVFKVIFDMFMIMFMWKIVTRPVYVFGGIGILSLGISFLMSLFIIVRKLFWGGAWVSPLLFLFVLFSTIGIQFILMGILAELIIRLYYRTRCQKRYKVKKVWSRKS